MTYMKNRMILQKLCKNIMIIWISLQMHIQGLYQKCDLMVIRLLF